MTRVLVLGNGQLGLMLGEAASRLGIELDRFDPDANELIHGTSPRRHAIPSPWNHDDYRWIVAEKEHFHEGQLDPWKDHSGFPQYEAIRSIADRRLQKSLLDRLRIPTAEWCVVQGVEDLVALRKRTDSGLIIKAATGGYDGRGQWRLDAKGEALLPEDHPKNAIAERRVDFQREVSIVGARSVDGHVAFYPLVENHHDDGMLSCTIAPAVADSDLQRSAEDMLGRVMLDLDYIGVMAMECFEEDGRLLVNELAPRVHNSGHWTQLGSSIDQFELHLRALCGWSLGPPKTRGVTAMLNLVGEDFEARWLEGGLAQCHWYGKEPRPARKLGHLNVNTETSSELITKLGELSVSEGSVLTSKRETAIGILNKRAR